MSKVLAGFLGAAGVAHFTHGKFFTQAVPPQLPGRRKTWVQGSGVAELAVAAAIAVPRTRRAGCLAAAALFVGVLPGNVWMAVEGFRKDVSPTRKALLLARLPLQIPLVVWALRASERQPVRRPGDQP